MQVFILFYKSNTIGVREIAHQLRDLATIPASTWFTTVCNFSAKKIHSSLLTFVNTRYTCGANNVGKTFILIH